MTTQQRIDAITEDLRAIYRDTNEGPRLIAELVAREFPNPRKVWNEANGRNHDRWGIPTTYPPSR